MKRFLSLLAAMLMVLAAVPAWATEYDSSLVRLDGTLPIVTDSSKVKPLKVFVSTEPSNLFPNEENAQAKRIFADTGVPIEWTVVSTTNAAELLNLELAGGSYPDIILRVGTKALVNQYMGMDVFLPLNNLIDSYMPNLKKVLDARPEYAAALYAPDGNIYGLPQIEELNGLVTNASQFLINQKWLDKLGLAMPTTIKELHEVLIAFRDGGDLNENGMDDEVPFAADFTVTSGHRNPFWAFVPCFGDGERAMYTGSYPFLNSNAEGQISFGADNTSFKECLKWFHALYAEGMFEDNAFATENIFTNHLLEGKYGIISVWSDVLPEDTYVPMAPITGEAGIWNSAKNHSEMQSSTAALITTACDRPELAAAWLDYQYVPEISFTSNWGAVGGPDDELRYVYDANGYIVFNVDENGKNINPEWVTGGDIRRSTTLFMGGCYAVLADYLGELKDLDGTADLVGQIDPNAIIVLNGMIANGKNEMDKVAYRVPANMSLLEEDSVMYAQISPQITNLVLSYYAGSILDGNVDETWDDYVASIKANGMDGMVAAIQHSYDFYKANMEAYLSK